MNPSLHDEEWREFMKIADSRMDSLEVRIEKELPTIVQDILENWKDQVEVPSQNSKQEETPKELEYEKLKGVGELNDDLLLKARMDEEWKTTSEDKTRTSRREQDQRAKFLEDLSEDERELLKKLEREQINFQMKNTQQAIQDPSLERQQYLAVRKIVSTMLEETRVKHLAQSITYALVEKDWREMTTNGVVANFLDEQIKTRADIHEKIEKEIASRRQKTPEANNMEAETEIRAQVITEVRKELEQTRKKEYSDTLYRKDVLPKVVKERLLPEFQARKKDYLLELEKQKLLEIDGRKLQERDPSWRLGNMEVWSSKSFNRTITVVTESAAYVKESRSVGGNKEVYYQAVSMETLRNAGVKPEDIQENKPLKFSVGQSIKR